MGAVDGAVGRAGSGEEVAPTGGREEEDAFHNATTMGGEGDVSVSGQVYNIMLQLAGIVCLFFSIFPAFFRMIFCCCFF